MSGWGNLSEEGNEAFWKEGGGIHKIDRLRECAMTTITHHQEELEETSFSWEHLPLSVWKQKGYERAMILQKATPTDTA